MSDINLARFFLQLQEIDIVIYHNSCHDGQTAAAIAYMKLGDSVEYVAKNPGELDPDYSKKYKDKHIILLDVSWTLENYLKVLNVAKRVLIIDHHKSSQNELGKVNKENGMCIFDMNESGASLAWKYFMNNNDFPLFVKYVKDRDIWQWKYRDESEPMYYGLLETHKKFKNEFKEYIKYIQEPIKIEELVYIGYDIIESIKNNIHNKSKDAKIGTICLDREYKICYIDLTGSKLPVSELCEYLYSNNDVDFIMAWFRQINYKNWFTAFISNYLSKKYIVSLRSNKDDIDLSQIAKYYGGGGHKSAAGFTSNKCPILLLTDESKNNNKNNTIIGLSVIGLFGFYFLKNKY